MTVPTPNPLQISIRAKREDDVIPNGESPFEDWGTKSVESRAALLNHAEYVVEADLGSGVAIVGSVSHHDVWYGPTVGSCAINIGISLAPEARGRGIGTTAQRLLAEHIFAIRDVVRVEASTDVDNIAEQRALERAGFTREGVLRSAQARADGQHDLISYSILRGDV